jgi:hypothetical protein
MDRLLTCAVASVADHIVTSVVALGMDPLMSAGTLVMGPQLISVEALAMG